jgi:hypothetical protein
MPGFMKPHLRKTKHGWHGIVSVPPRTLHGVALPSWVRVDGAATAMDAFSSLDKFRKHVMTKRE